MPDPKDNVEAAPQGTPAVDTSNGQKPNEGQAPSTQPEWLEPNFKSVEEQAKSYSEARKAMTRANQEAARVKEELARLQSQANPPYGADRANQPPQATEPSTPATEIPFHVRTAIEAKYPGVQAEQIVAMYDLLNASLAPIKNTIYGSQVESAKEKFAKEAPHFDKYRAEIDSLLSRYPIEDRLKPQTIQTCYAWVVNQHLKELESEWMEQGRKEASVKPAVPSFAGDAGSNGGSPTPSGSGFKMTAAQKEVAVKMGLNPEDVEKSNQTLRGGK